MNDYKELIYALKSCQHIASNCIDCPLSNTKYYNYKTKECEVHLHNVAADVIEQLVRERDAAVADLKRMSRVVQKIDGKSRNLPADKEKK